MSQLESNRYCLSDNDLMIIKGHTDKPLSENAKKTLTILSEVFGGLHHLDSDQLELFDYQSDWYNQYLIQGSLSTWDFQNLTLLVIMAHDMAVRFEIQATVLDKDNDFDMKLIQKQLDDINSEYGYSLTVEQFLEEPRPYLRLLFHQRTREGDISYRHPTLEDSMQGFREGNKRYG
ncbi:MAG: hypothetical protein AABY07_07485 [Nanoarchaeota archaeon]